MYPSLDKRPFVLLVAEAFFSLITSTETRQVIKYDLGDESLSVFNVPPMVADRSEIPPALVTAEDGGLGLAHVDKFGLHLWSYDDGVAEWTLDRVVDLNKMPFPIGGPMISPQVAGAVEGAHTIFVVTDIGAYMIDLNSLTSKKLSQKICSTVGKEVIFHIFPYLSFFNRPGTFHLKMLISARILFFLMFCTSFLEHRTAKQDLFRIYVVFLILSHHSPDNITGGGAASIRRSKQNRRPNPKYL
jgi:hypothetical protein